jgi:type II secretory pathway pseudopilin PulG
MTRITYHVSRNNQHLTKGFTLIEAIVATALFAMVVSAIIGVYLSTIQLDRKVRAQRLVNQNARFIIDFLGKEIRNGTIDYSAFTPTDNCSVAGACIDLHIKNQANEAEHFYASHSNCSSSNPCDLVLVKNGGTATNLNPAAVKVTKLKFFVQPLGDPFTTARTYNTQPHVTVALELTATTGANVSDKSTINLQSTFTSRIYPSRASGVVSGDCVSGNLVANGGFETPTVTNIYGWDIFPDGTAGLGWNVNWTSAVTPYDGNPVPDPANTELVNVSIGWDSAEGDQMIQLDSDWDGPAEADISGEPANTSLSQTFATVLNGAYRLSFEFSAEPGWPDNIMEIYWNGGLIGTVDVDGSANANTVWIPYSFDLTALGSSTALEFREVGTGESHGSLLDNVIVCEL